jgi:FKBP-type peptidyl-prolyl cis-trans isomerase SlyD
MQVGKDAVVFMDYTLTNDEGEIIDASEAGEPLAYLHGHGNIISGLEKELEGRKTGDEMEVTIAPDDGYGEFNSDLIKEVPKSQLAGIPDLEVGMQLEMSTPEGDLVVTVTKIGKATVTIDGNHPLAGQNLNFRVKIVDVREATKEELAHGHVHDGDHDH